MSCSAAYGAGGTGRHFAEIVERYRRAGTLSRYFSPACRPGDEAFAEIVREPVAQLLVRYTPLRFSQGWCSHLSSDLFDRAVARRLEQRVDEFVGFNGQALRTFRRAEALGCQRFGLIAATAHVNRVARQHTRALAYCAEVEPGWLHPAQLRKTLLEYQRAETIYVGSDYSRQSFIAEGIAPDQLVRLHYPLDPRFVPGAEGPGEGFRVVYTGSL